MNQNEVLPKKCYFVLRQVIIAFKSIFVGIKNGQAFICQHLWFIQCIIWIPLEELQIWVIQVLPAFHALGRGRLEEKCMTEKLHLEQNQGHQKCVINSGISAESNFENNILEYGINCCCLHG
uniref:Uncharacterized protein n=1 Tax=Micrurus surinamensis TaxID=129470 RepID=A0A2D4NTS3_MICSU